MRRTARQARGMRVLLLASWLPLLGCGGMGSLDDAGPVDAGSSDAGSIDAGSMDAGSMDAGSIDAGSLDAGSLDAGSALDGGGQRDAGSARDAGPPVIPACRANFSPERTTGRNSSGVSFELHRCIGGPICAGGCPAYAVYFALTHGGATYAALEPDIAYTATHHNWTDHLVATLPDRRTYWRIEFDFGGTGVVHRHYVRSEALDGTPILPETELREDP